MRLFDLDLLQSPRNQRRIIFASVLVLVAGVVAVLVTVVGNTGHRTNAPISTKPAQLVKKHVSVPLDPAVRDVAHRFIQFVVGRKNVAAGYDLVSSALRGTMSRQRWATGDIPVIPYPAVRSEAYRIDYSYTDEAQLDVGLVAKDPGVKRTTFTINLVKDPKTHRWLVDYWAPKYRPPVPLSPVGS
jgi:hypothetical protein